MQQWPTDVNNHSVGQEIPCIFWCPNTDNVYISQPERILSSNANPTPLISIFIFFLQCLSSQLPSGCIAWEFQTNSSNFTYMLHFPPFLSLIYYVN